MPNRGRRSTVFELRWFGRLVGISITLILLALLLRWPGSGSSNQALAAADGSPSAEPSPGLSESPASPTPNRSSAPAAAQGSQAASAPVAASASARPVASRTPVPTPTPTPAPASTPPDGLPADLSPDCIGSTDALARADEMLANRYRLGAWPVVTLPSNLAWTENPLHDNNWMFQEHTLRFVLDLFSATRSTGETKYQTRGLAILQDWIHDNPRVGARSVWAWNDHSTALRSVVLACTADLLGMPSWLRSALLLHGATLAQDSFYRHEGNHALNQSIGLLEVARVLNRSDWKTLAQNRINTLLSHSVDNQGVTNEQSVGYERYNYTRYQLARDRLIATGLTPGAIFHRLDLMPAFLAHATLPDGTYEMIGDTLASQASRIAGTAAEYAATRGASGPKPSKTIARFSAGYLFARSGWGERRDPVDETFFATKWGPGPVFHGHADGLELTLAGWGSRLLLDSGEYSYTSSPYRTYFKQRQAHNVVTVDGMAWNTKAVTRLLQYHETSAYVDLQLQAAGYSGVTHTRRITYSRGLDYLIVEDRLVSSSTHTYRQLWHFREDARPVVGASSVWTQRARGNVIVRQLTGAPSVTIVRGRTSPVQGWLSYAYGVKVAAPVEEAVQRGASVRYITFIAPSSGKPTAKLSDFRKTTGGYSVVVTVGAHRERLTVDGSSISLTPLS